MNPQIYETHNQHKKSFQCNPHDKVQSLGHGSVMSPKRVHDPKLVPFPLIIIIV